MQETISRKNGHNTQRSHKQCALTENSAGKSRKERGSFNEGPHTAFMLNLFRPMSENQAFRGAVFEYLGVR
jgi:hypothetical protein